MTCIHGGSQTHDPPTHPPMPIRHSPLGWNASPLQGYPLALYQPYLFIHQGLFCSKADYRIYPCISRPFMASKEAPKIALDLYMGQRFRAKFQLNNLFKINIIMWSLGITITQWAKDFKMNDERLQNECN